MFYEKIKKIGPTVFNKLVSLGTWRGGQRREQSVVNGDGDLNKLAGEILQSFKPRSVIDIGCGNGKLLEELKRLSPGIRLVGIETTTTAVNTCRARGLDVFYLNIAELREDTVVSMQKTLGRFDLSICHDLCDSSVASQSEKLMGLVNVIADRKCLYHI